MEQTHAQCRGPPSGQGACLGRLLSAFSAPCVPVHVLCRCSSEGMGFGLKRLGFASVTHFVLLGARSGSCNRAVGLRVQPGRRWPQTTVLTSGSSSSTHGSPRATFCSTVVPAVTRFAPVGASLDIGVQSCVCVWGQGGPFLTVRHQETRSVGWTAPPAPPGLPTASRFPLTLESVPDLVRLPLERTPHLSPVSAPYSFLKAILKRPKFRFE